MIASRSAMAAIVLFWGEVLRVFYMTIGLAIPPLTVKNRGGGGGGVRLFRTVRLIGQIRYV